MHGRAVPGTREGERGHIGRIVPHDESKDARPPHRDTDDIHAGKMAPLELANGTVVSRRDHNFDIGVRRKDIRAREETGGIVKDDK